MVFSKYEHQCEVLTQLSVCSPLLNPPCVGEWPKQTIVAMVAVRGLVSYDTRNTQKKIYEGVYRKVQKRVRSFPPWSAI